jgi:hypothetical protein
MTTSSIGAKPPELITSNDELPEHDSSDTSLESEFSEESEELIIPEEFKCPLTLEIMTIPFKITCLSKTPHIFEQNALLDHIEMQRKNHLAKGEKRSSFRPTCPMDRQPFDSFQEDYALEAKIETWAKENKYTLPSPPQREHPELDKEDSASDSDSDEEDPINSTSPYGYYPLATPAPAAQDYSIDPEAAICCCFISCTIICTIVFAILASLAESLGYIAPAPKYIFI